MNSTITLEFNSVPLEGTQITLVDSAYPSIQMKETFVSVRTKAGETYRTSTVNQCASYYRFALGWDYSNPSYTVTWLNGTVKIESSNPESQFSVESNTTASTDILIDNNAGTGDPSELPDTDITAINDASKITFANSPIHLRLQNAAADTTIEEATVYLWIWNGDQQRELVNPNLTLNKKKVSAGDNYINFQIADYIKSYIENPPNGLNTNQPNFAYNELTPPAITGLGVFWQVVTDITSNGTTIRTTGDTHFATLGYRWGYEQNAIKNNGLTPNGSTGFIRSSQKWYNKKIHNYIEQSFDLTKTVSEATTGNIIKTTPVTPPSVWERCSRDSSLIVYINKLGLWEMFTPHGKIVVSSSVSSDEQNRAYRDPSQIDNTYTHSKLKSSPDVEQSYTINTGSLTETMIDQVEQIIYSPKIYIILFNGDVQTSSTVGVTIDSTFITIDDTNITIDAATVTEELIGSFKTFQQIPVISKDKSFVRKNRINDKNEIHYTLKFEETTNKILDIR